ncbi:MAG: hypothetical protein DRJ51_02335 [Thermoprotei archaeon]|nr:MAG: hypothetical protein DRJ51_02335 [Thermoprotei archaeon]
MLSHSQIIKLNKWAKNVNGRIVFRFKKYPYALVLDGVIHAEDFEGKAVSWSQAFGPQVPSDVLLSYKLKEIEVRMPGKELVFKTFKEFKEFFAKVLEA